MAETIYINGHLIDMDSLLDAKLWHKYVESSIKDTHHFGLANNRAVAVSKVGNEDA